jgi:hypothetical protein
VYCNCDRPVVQEIVYPPHADWKDIISIAERFDEHTLNILTPKYVQFYDQRLDCLKFAYKYPIIQINELVFSVLKFNSNEVIVFYACIVTFQFL